MVTGDKLETARAIAILCGIITKEEKMDPSVCVTGPAFFDMMGGLWCTTCKKGTTKPNNDCVCEPE